MGYFIKQQVPGSISGEVLRKSTTVRDNGFHTVVRMGITTTNRVLIVVLLLLFRPNTSKSHHISTIFCVFINVV